MKLTITCVISTFLTILFLQVCNCKIHIWLGVKNFCISVTTFCGKRFDDWFQPTIIFTFKLKWVHLTKNSGTLLRTVIIDPNSKFRPKSIFWEPNHWSEKLRWSLKMTAKYDLLGVFYDMYMCQATWSVRKMLKNVLHALKLQI